MSDVVWRADSARSGFVPRAPGEAAPQLRWSWTGERNQQSPPIIAGGSVLFGGRDRRLRSVRAASGALDWQAQVDGAIGGAVAVDGGRVVAGCEDGSVYSFDAATGSVLWRAEIGVPIGSAPLVTGGVVVVAVGGTRPGLLGGGVAALALGDGRRLWLHETEAGCLASPAASDGSVVYASRGGELGALDLADGRPRWRDDSGSDRTGTPAIERGAVVSDSGAASVEARRLDDGRLLWSFQLGRSAPMSSPALAGGSALVGGGDGHLYALDLATGRPRWTSARIAEHGWESFASPVVVGHTVVVGCSDGSVSGFGAADGAQRWRADLSDPGATWTSAHASGDMLTLASVHAKTVHLLAWTHAS